MAQRKDTTKVSIIYIFLLRFSLFIGSWCFKLFEYSYLRAMHKHVGCSVLQPVGPILSALHCMSRSRTNSMNSSDPLADSSKQRIHTAHIVSTAVKQDSTVYKDIVPNSQVLHTVWRLGNQMV